MLSRAVGLLLLLVSASSAESERKDHVTADILSDEVPGSKEYDHEAFLGEDISETFDELTPEESKQRLEVIFEKIDGDRDGLITEAELDKWITVTQDRYIEDDTSELLLKHDLDQDGKVHWDEYYKNTYGNLKNSADWSESIQKGFSYNDMLEKDKRRWKAVDTDEDNSCNKEEFKAFWHPQKFDHMKDIVLEELMSELDKNKDGYLDLEEYIEDFYQPESTEEPEPDWVTAEKEQFRNDKDKDKDGRLDEKEVRDWIMPEGHNYSLAEAKHLIKESDSDQDGVLTKKEVLDHYDVFVGSQATEWAQMLEGHDEF